MPVSINTVFMRLPVHQVNEYEQVTKDVNRSAYTQRIMEIVTNIKRQNQDIDKVLSLLDFF